MEKDEVEAKSSNFSTRVKEEISTLQVNLQYTKAASVMHVRKFRREGINGALLQKLRLYGGKVAGTSPRQGKVLL